MNTHGTGSRGASASGPSGIDAVADMMSSLAQRVDPFGVATSVLAAQAAWMMHAQALSREIGALSADIFAVQAHLVYRSLGMPDHDVIPQNADDARFADPVWSESPGWDYVKESYLAITRRLEDMLFETPGLTDKERRRAAFWVRNWLNAMAPTNFFSSNPVAMRRFIETRGQSLVSGFANFMRDAQAGNIRMVEPDAYEVGVDLAITPGRVVFRNRLVELLHYTPQTPRVHRMPIVIITPWINKFYVLDLTPRRSLVKYLTEQGYSVLITSWKNPTAEMADVGFDDYLLDGVDQVVEAARRLSGSARVHLAGYCIGGTLVATYMAWASRRYGARKMPVAHWTLLTTLTDFSQPGDIDVFIGEGAVRALEEKMARTGYLDGDDMASTFRLLRSNSLIWHYVERSYLLGEPLGPIDVLYWNMDTTRMPAAMHAFYLRQMYLNNKLIERDALTIAGEPIDLGRIRAPLYAVGAEEDHIVPWRQAYRIRDCIDARAPVRFVLTSSGHIFGIVNAVVSPPRRNFRAAESGPAEDVDQWLARTASQPGSWWEDWLAWLSPRCGPMVEPPDVDAEAYPDLGPAPGTYVFEH